MNILDRATNMKRVSTNKGGEYHGPCPICTPADKVGISNRMHIWPGQDDGRGSWWCRSCDKGGDALQWLRDIEGMSYKQACAAVGKEYDPKQDASEPTAVDKKKQFTPAPQKTTDPTWQERAERFITWSHENLKDDPATLEWLANQRGISLQTIKDMKLGLNIGENGKDIYRPRKVWALPEVLREDGKPKKLWLPVGITIPWYSNQQPVRVRIRRPEGEPRYYVVPGSVGSPMLLDATPIRAWKTIIVVESELDAIMLYSQCGHLAAFIGLGSCSTRPDSAIIGKMIEEQRGKGQAIQIKTALDNDSAGIKEVKWWSENFGATNYPLPEQFKDPGEAFQGGFNLVQWVENALPAAYKVGQMPQKQSEYVAKPASTPPPLVQSMTDRKGRPYIITDSRDVYREKMAAGEVVFSPVEIKAAANEHDIAEEYQPGMGAHLMDLVMTAKNVFPGSYISKTELL